MKQVGNEVTFYFTLMLNCNPLLCQSLMSTHLSEMFDKVVCNLVHLAHHL